MSMTKPARIQQDPNTEPSELLQTFTTIPPQTLSSSWKVCGGAIVGASIWLSFRFTASVLESTFEQAVQVFFGDNKAFSSVYSNHLSWSCLLMP